MTSKKNILKIKLSDTICITDPAYTRKLTHCAAFNFKVKAGNYVVNVEYSDEKDWGIRVKSLAIFHESVKVSRHGFKLNKSMYISVDSGQAGFFCDSIYPKGEDTGDYGDKNSFYGKCCAATSGSDGDPSCLKALIRSYENMEKLGAEHITILNELKKELKQSQNKQRDYNSIMGAGVVSSSGFGDGGYSLYEKKNAAGEVVALKIKYI